MTKSGFKRKRESSQIDNDLSTHHRMMDVSVIYSIALPYRMSLITEHPL